MSEPTVVLVIRSFRDELLRREADQMAVMTQQWLAIEKALEGEMLRLAMEIGQMQASGETVSQAKILRMARYKNLLKETRAELQRYTDWLGPQIQQQQLGYGLLGLQQAQAATGAMMMELGYLGISFNRLPISAIEAMVAEMGAGSPLNKLLKAAWPDSVEGLTDALVKGVALGKNPSVVAQEMADGFGVGLNRAMTIARTEQLRVYREVQRQQYATSGNFIGYRRMCAKDKNTCIACLLADGRFYTLDTAFEEHPNGRCVLAPVPRDIAGYEWEKGGEWFAKQDAATQEAIMGAGRYAAWKDGRFGLQDIVKRTHSDDWGDALVPKTLKELMGGA